MSFNKTDTDFVYILNVGQEKGWCAMHENYNKAKLKEIYISWRGVGNLCIIKVMYFRKKLIKITTD